MTEFFLKVQNLLERKNWAAFFLIGLLFLQLVYSFRFPANGFDENWLPIGAYLPKFSVEPTDNFLLSKFYHLISLDYRLNSGVGDYLVLARNFSPDYFKNHAYLNRPLYPFLILLSSYFIRPFISPSYGILFGLAILINFLTIALAVLLFFNLLKKLFSFKVAFLSSILLIFSPFVHSCISQPIPEMVTAAGVVVSLYLLYKYINSPSFLKLIVFSLASGIFMLGKMFLATPIFLILIALHFRRYKEGIIGLIFFFVPFAFWYFWVTQVWGISYYVHEVQQWHMGFWLMDIFREPWHQSFRIIINAVPNFVADTVYAFILIPLFFSLVGSIELKDRVKRNFYYLFILSGFLLAFIINLYFYRHAFMLFPVIYPTAILGIEKIADSLKRYHSWCYPLFYLTSLGLIIAISSLNIYQVYYYLN